MAELPFKNIRESERPFLITGHTGFKGTWLALFLREHGVKTVGISLPAEKDSLYSKISEPIVDQEYFIDIRNFNLLKDAVREIRPNYVLHLAAQALVSDAYASPLETFEVNVMGTANLLHTILELGDPCTVGIVTTDKVYENKNTGQSFLENDPILGKDPYSASKAATENVIEAWKTISEKNKILNLVTLRSGNVIGGGDLSKDRLLPDFIRATREREVIEVKNPTSTRPWQHVLDPLFGYLTALEWAAVNNKAEAFNFGPTDASLEVQKVLEIANDEYSGQEVACEFNAAEIYEAQKLDLDSNKSKEVLAWSAIWSQELSIRKTIKWWESYFEGESAIKNCQRDISEYMQDLH